MVRKVCIYCASSPNIDEKYFSAAEELTKTLVSAGVAIIYGGGSVGLMGKVADTAIKMNGVVIGIIPEFMQAIEWGHNGISELRIVGDMHERKKKMADEADAVIAMPGGCGTLEELLEVITWKRLGLFTQPIIILNVDGYFDPLIQMLNRCISEGFMGDKHRHMWTVLTDPENILTAIENAPPWDQSAIQFARV